MNKALRLLLFSLICFSFAFSGCKSDVPENTIPYVPVYEELNLSDLRYQALQQVNGYVYLSDNIGFRGIVIHSDGGGTYRAFDRACPYHPQEACAQVSMHSSGFYLQDNCCESTFNLSGDPTGGPARSPLRRYRTFVDGNFLIISSD